MRGEALDPVKVLCPNIGECWGQEAGVGGVFCGLWASRRSSKSPGVVYKKNGPFVTFTRNMQSVSGSGTFLVPVLAISSGSLGFGANARNGGGVRKT